MIPIEIDQEAEGEIDDIDRYYSDLDPNLHTAWERELTEAFEFQRRFPQVGAAIGSRLRQWSLKVFPYVVIDEAQPHRLLVIAVAHHKRRPGYWKKRLKPNP